MDGFQPCDRAMVRNGETVGGRTSDLTYDDIVKLMIGTKEISGISSATGSIGELVAESRGISRKGILEDINLSCAKGNGQGCGACSAQAVRRSPGLWSAWIPLTAARSRCGGRRAERCQDSEAKNWIGMVTENRREEGLLLLCR
jgi:ribose transport system ATP-binding protein